MIIYLVAFFIRSDDQTHGSRSTRCWCMNKDVHNLFLMTGKWKQKPHSCKPRLQMVVTKYVISSLLSLFVIKVLSLNLFMAFYQIKAMKQETNPAVFLAEWKKEAHLSLTLKLVRHTRAQQSVLLFGWTLPNNDSVGSSSLS